MIKKEDWKNKKSRKLFKAILCLKNPDETERFFRDLLTPGEIKAFAERLEVAEKLSEGKTYREIAQKTKASTTTVTRVNQWLNNGMNGYKLVLNRLNSEKNKVHTKAASSA